MTDTTIPDYTGHEEVPAEDRLTQLRVFALQMLKLEAEIEEIDAQKKTLDDKRKKLAHDLIPKLMKAIGLDEIKLTGSVKIIVKDEIRTGRLPEDGRWKEYLEKSGNDGIIKREFMIAYGRDSTRWAEAFAQSLKDMGVAQNASVAQSETIHSSTLAAFLRDERMTNPDVIEMFGAFVQTMAKIKSE